jgi:hypothetical protein
VWVDVEQEIPEECILFGARLTASVCHQLVGAPGLPASAIHLPTIRVQRSSVEDVLYDWSQTNLQAFFQANWRLLS